MMYSIKGTIIVLQEGTLCIENHGITWELCISLHTFDSLSPHYLAHTELAHTELAHTTLTDTTLEQKTASETHVYTYLHANDKGMHLYGFYSLAERSVFLTLQKVSGIGPKAAIKILSHTTPELLMGFIKNQDTKSLSKISGIGAKKASAILLALEGVYVSPQSTAANKTGRDTEQDASKKAIGSDITGANADIINGLIKMGYEKNAIDRAIESMKQPPPRADTQNPERAGGHGRRAGGQDSADMDEGIFMHNIIMRLES